VNGIAISVSPLREKGGSGIRPEIEEQGRGGRVDPWSRAVSMWTKMSKKVGGDRRARKQIGKDKTVKP